MCGNEGVKMKIKTKYEIASDAVSHIDKGFQVVNMTQAVESGDKFDDRIISVYITRNHIEDRFLSKDHKTRIVNYHDPIGRLAVLSEGDTCELSYLSRDFRVMQKNRFIPDGDIEGKFFWGDRVELERNLREYVKRGPNDEPLLEKQQEPANNLTYPRVQEHETEEKDIDSLLLDTNYKQSNAGNLKRLPTDQVSRNVITEFGLSGQDLLDEIQDSIMRESPYINRVLMGAAGTGKTTTMIKKLGMNLDSEYSGIQGIKNHSSLSHEIASWYMFTPTELLKSYLKEAFAREGVAAPDENVFVWDVFTNQLGKDLKILKSTPKDSGYVCTGQTALKNISAESQIELYEKFNAWRTSFLHKALAEYYDTGMAFNDEAITHVLQEGFVDGIEPNIFTESKNEATWLVYQMYFFEDKVYNKPGAFETEQDRSFLGKIAKLKASFESRASKLILDVFKASYFKGKDNKGVSDLIQETYAFASKGLNSGSQVTRRDNEIWNEIIVPSVEKYLSGKTDLETKLVANFLKFDSELKSLDRQVKDTITLLSKKIVYLTQIQKLFNTPREKYIRSTISLYKEFRKSHPELYKQDIFNSSQIDQFELDMLILSCMNIIYKFNELASLDTRNTKKLDLAEKLEGFQRLQVFVDELTDFSPIQLKIMYNLMPDQKKIFFGTGDFMQTLTSHGTKNMENLRWAIPNVQVCELNVYYRQTKQLTELSQALKKKDLSVVKAPSFIDVSGVPAVMGLSVSGNTDIANWIKDRLSEIVQNTEGILPSIAVLVESEERVEPLAKQLNTALQEFNIKVEACVNGKNLGTKSTVRVFCVDHIKGLEFEGVFFVNIDKLEKIKENSFKNFLYVGASRAAKFFGITAEGAEMPQQLSGLKHLFVQDWQQEDFENMTQVF